MCKICELCQIKNAWETRLGIQLCEDCMEGFWKVMSNDKGAIRKYAKEEDFPNATINAKQQIISLAKRKLDAGVETLELRHVEKIEPFYAERLQAENKTKSEVSQNKIKPEVLQNMMDVQRGIKLTSPDALDDLSAKCNILYVIFAILGAIFLGGQTNIIIGVVFGLIAGWAVKGPMILKSATYKFRTMEFTMPENVTLEEIYKTTSQALAAQGIDVTLQGNELEFQHGAIHYQFLTDGTDGTFRLRWYYSVAKSMFGASYIQDYKAVRQDTGVIAYAIQNVNI